MQYRRAFIPGGSFFFTVVTAQRRPILVTSLAVEVLRGAFRSVQSSRPFAVNAIVVLPDHLHCIWTLPPGDGDFANRWRLIKTQFTKRCASALHLLSEPDRKKSPWQHRYWEHALRDETDFMRHVEYIHFNPVKHRLVTSAFEWPYSSFRRYVRAGLYPADWGCDEVKFEGIGRE